MTPLRLGITGFGRLARDYYLPALATLPEMQLVAIADPLPASRAAARSQGRGARVYEALPAMLEAAGLEALLVASPPSDHFAAWRLAHAAGVAAFVEKPLLLARELPLVGPDERDARVMVDFNRRGALEAFARAVRTCEGFSPGVGEGLWNARCVAATTLSAAAGGAPARP